MANVEKVSVALTPEMATLVRQAVEDSLYLYFDESGAIALDGA